jgi:hypothetical protein
MRMWLAVVGLIISGCSLGTTTTQPPPAPILPEITYVAPDDPTAVAGLTQEAVEALRNRDLLLRRHIQRLEQQIRGGQ